MKTLVSVFPVSMIWATRRWPSARVKPASIKNACSSPVIKVAVLFLEPTGKSRSMTVKSRVLMGDSFRVGEQRGSLKRRSGRDGEGLEAALDLVDAGVTDGHD